MKSNDQQIPPTKNRVKNYYSKCFICRKYF